MGLGGMFGNQAIGGLAVRNLNVSLLARMLQQQRIAAAAMIDAMEGGTPQPPRSEASAPPAPSRPSAPPQGGSEPGKGGLVDVSA